MSGKGHSQGSSMLTPTLFAPCLCSQEKGRSGGRRLCKRCQRRSWWKNPQAAAGGTRGRFRMRVHDKIHVRIKKGKQASCKLCTSCFRLTSAFAIAGAADDGSILDVVCWLNKRSACIDTRSDGWEDLGGGAYKRPGKGGMCPFNWYSCA
jgi:hypothetical protein